MKFATKPLQHYYLTLGMLLRYVVKIKIQFFADLQQIWKKMQTNCIF